MDRTEELPVVQPEPAGDESGGNDRNLTSPLPTGRWTLAQVRQTYPCDGCKAPCCSYLPLHTFNVSHLRDLDHALYLLNFPRIELGVNSNGAWGVYYRYPCRFLDRETALCTIYGSEFRPSICAHYNPYSCWYKQALVPNVHESFLRIDIRRMNAILGELTFDDSLNIAGSPDWQTMLRMLEKLPLAPAYDEDIAGDPVFERWLYEAAYGAPAPAPEPRFSYTSLSNPCTGCSAYCCKYLVFPQAAPTNRVTLDYLQFVLGFPGLEIGVSDEAWFVIVKTTCRHLSENRCSIYGKPERPQICTFYDAHGCQYVPQFGVPRPQRFMRIGLEQFFWLVEGMEFDRSGNVTLMPPIEELRRHVERRWQEEILNESQRAKATESATVDEVGTSSESV